MRPLIRIHPQSLRADSTVEEQRRLLVDACGSYCFFCEVPLGNDACVMSRVPTTHNEVRIGDQTVRLHRSLVRVPFWSGLCLSCSACMAAAQTRSGLEEDLRHAPPADLANIAGNPLPGRFLEVQTEALYRLAADTLIWPDSAEEVGEGEAGRASRIGFQGGDSWNAFRLEAAQLSQCQLADRNLLGLTAQEREAPWAQLPRPGIWVTATDENDERALRTIRRFGLNACNPNNADRRVELRTAAWSFAERARAELAAAAAALPGESEAQRSRALLGFASTALPGGVRRAIAATGFWSVWADRLVRNLPRADHPWNRFAAPALNSFLASLLVEFEISVSGDVPDHPEVEMDPDPSSSSPSSSSSGGIAAPGGGGGDSTAMGKSG